MLSFVPRWSIAPRLTDQSDAEHCFFVTLYASQLCDYFGVDADITVLILNWAIRHDAYEIWTGDPPGPAKHHFIDPVKLEAYIDRFAQTVEDFGVYRTAIYKDNETLKDVALRIIKAADLIDECFYLRYELAMGNVLVKDLFNLSMDRLDEQLRLWGEDKAEYLMACLKRELSRIEGEGALIPSLKE